MFQQNLPQLGSSSNFAHKGIKPYVFHSGHPAPILWIVDSGASDHMTGNLRLFTTYRPCTTPLTVCGSLSNVVGIGTIKFSDSFILSSKLYVPSLHCNLLSVSKLTNR